MPIGPFSSVDIPDDIWDANAAQWRAAQDHYDSGGDDTLSGGAGDDTIATTAPRLGADRPGVGPILGIASQGEGTAGPNGYDATFNGRRYPQGWKKPTELTLDQWTQIQPVLRKMNGGDAMGKYQFKPDMLGELKKSMGLTGSEIMTPKLQDEMAEQRLYQKRHYGDFLAGRMTAEQFQAELAKEWSSLPEDASGNSHYPDAHRRPVKARVTPDDTLKAILAAKSAQQVLDQQIDGGQQPP